MEDLSYCPLISVIVPVFNVEHYLFECLNSLKNQTYRNLEILLIDDGSTDDSASVCLRFLGDSRFRYFKKESGGVSSARNYGLDVFKGDYVAFVDADDFIDKNLFMFVVQELNNKKSEIVQFGYFMYHSVKKRKRIIVTHKKKGDALREYVLYGPDVVWNKVYSRDVFDTLRFENGIIHEDSYILPIILSLHPDVVTIKKELYFYRQRSDSIVHRQFDARRLDALLAADNLVKIAKESHEELLPLCYARAMVCAAFLYSQCVNSSNCDNNHLNHILSRYVEYKEAIKQLKGRNRVKFSWRLEIMLFEISKRLFTKVFK